LAKTSEPDRAITRFDKFLHGLPTGIQLFSMLSANPDLMDLLADLMGDAPRLEEYLSRNPGVLDAVIDGDFLSPQPPLAELKQSLNAGVKLARDLQEALDVVRRFAKERRFQLGVQSLKALYDADELGRGYTNLAEAAIAALFPVVAEDFAVRERRGYIPGADLVILAMGKFGSWEMTGTSDLDMVFIYDFDPAIEASDGERPLHPTLYFARLCQRLLNAITAPTAEGTLYEVDMRLRPSGNKGPVATQLKGFIDYHHDEAWTWEHMALTRGRVIYGPQALQKRVEEVILQVLCQPREPAKIATDAAKMRGRIFKEKGSKNPWDLKHVRGGLVDLEFICQYHQLIAANSHPQVLSPHNRDAFVNLKSAGALPAEIADQLAAASMLYSNLSALVRVAVSDIFDPQKSTPGLASAMASAGGAENIADLQTKLIGTQTMVRNLFDTTLGVPDSD
jgi:glutamate-ammonia-ligase adenylyltransferase